MARAPPSGCRIGAWSQPGLASRCANGESSRDAAGEARSAPAGRHLARCWRRRGGCDRFCDGVATGRLGGLGRSGLRARRWSVPGLDHRLGPGGGPWQACSLERVDFRAGASVVGFFGSPDRRRRRVAPAASVRRRGRSAAQRGHRPWHGAQWRGRVRVGPGRARRTPSCDRRCGGLFGGAIASRPQLPRAHALAAWSSSRHGTRLDPRRPPVRGPDLVGAAIGPGPWHRARARDRVARPRVVLFRCLRWDGNGPGGGRSSTQPRLEGPSSHRRCRRRRGGWGGVDLAALLGQRPRPAGVQADALRHHSLPGQALRRRVDQQCVGQRPPKRGLPH